jgi:hypothetical protein
MKKLILLFLIALTTGICNAQNVEKAPKSESKAVSFSSRNGSLITKTFYKLDKIGSIEFEVLLLKDEVVKDKIACLRVKTSSYTTKDTYIGTLDYDELDACIKALNYIKDNLVTTTPTNYIESEYKSKDGVCFGTYFNDNGKWVIYVQPKSYSSYALKTITVDELGTLISRLKEASTKIKEVLSAN